MTAHSFKSGVLGAGNHLKNTGQVHQGTEENCYRRHYETRPRLIYYQKVSDTNYIEPQQRSPTLLFGSPDYRIIV